MGRNRMAEQSFSHKGRAWVSGKWNIYITILILSEENIKNSQIGVCFVSRQCQEVVITKNISIFLSIV